MNYRKIATKAILYSSLAAVMLVSCSKDDDVIVSDENTTTDEVYNDTEFETPDWTDATHGKGAVNDFDEIFNDTEVKRLDIVITSERWESMMEDMTNLYGTFGVSSRPGEGGSFSDEDPIFVPAEVFYNGKEWYRVGIRFKGNSSLSSTWGQGNLKLSLKLDFDQFEDTYPQINNQRFYGFKKLSLKNNYDDKSFIREKVAADIFRDAGLAISHTAFYTLYVDHGDGPQYFGLYTLVEEVDNTVIDDQFSSDKGNLYKPEDLGSSFAYGTFSQSDFEKKNNEDEMDWSDIQNLFTVLHDESRTTDAATWRTNLDNIFDTDVFLKYLAINTVIQNWDTYGIMTHNYYLYNNPENSKLTWIPWDNNEALQDGKMQGTLNLDFSNLQANNWPLIEYLYADEVYKAKYDTYVEECVNNWFETSKMQALYTKYADLIEPYATSEVSGYTFLQNTSEFQQAISTLKTHVASRKTAADNYLK